MAGGIMIVAGEASGDLHGGNLASALRQLKPDIELYGMGGASMRAAGVNTLVDISRLAVVGFWEVLTHLTDIKRALNAMTKALNEKKPRLLVLIDYPEFNFRLAARAKTAGVPVVYYISPQIWAWRRGRVKTMARLARKVLVIYPFEADFYRQAGVDCVYVGNPLLDAASIAAPRSDFDPDRPVLGLLPGSRVKELHNHLPVMLRAFDLLAGEMPGLRGIIPVAATLDAAQVASIVGQRPNIAVVKDDFEAAIDLVDAAVVASGTATLQTALHEKPMIIIYRLAPLTYWLARYLVKVPFIGIVNIIAGEEVAPELIQHRVTPGGIADAVKPLLTDEARRQDVRSRLRRVREKLGPPGASRRAASEVLAVWAKS